MPAKKETSEKVKIFVLDTNVLVHDPDSVLSFEENRVIIPYDVLEELDNLKKGKGEVAYSARKALNLIDSFRNGGDLSRGVNLPCGGVLQVYFAQKNYFREKKPDNYIISAALALKKNNKEKVFFVSKDTAARLKAESKGLKAQDYLKDKTTLFQKYGKLLKGDDYSNGIFSVRYCALGDDIFRIWEKDLRSLIKRRKTINGIAPKNIEQECAVDALTNPEIKTVALTGIAGSGKTLLALAAGLYQTLKSDQLYKQVVVARPVVPMGEDLGYLPGTKEEKINPWMKPIFNNLEVIMKTSGKETKDGVNCGKFKNYEYLMEGGFLEIEVLAYIRGGSLPDRYFIIDEAQNLIPREVKTIITRCGEGTKIIFTGDLDQIDTPCLDKQSNGLAYLIDRFINEPYFCYLNLVRSERSYLAERAALLL